MSVLAVAGLAAAAGFALILLAALTGRKPRPFEASLTFSQFEQTCYRLMDEMKLQIEEAEKSGPCIDLLVRNPAPIVGGLLLVRCLYLEPDGVVTAAQILELSNLVVQERVTKGVFLTTGRFTPDRATLTELAPIEFIDGEALRKRQAILL